MVKRYNEEEYKQLVKILKNDGIISVPTDTVFGLCARIDSKIAYNKLMKIKNRPVEKSFPVMCADIEQIYSIATINNVEEKIIKIFMPGPITLILNKKDELPRICY